MSSMGGWAPYVSKAGIFKSSMKKTEYFPIGGPYIPFRLSIAENYMNINIVLSQFEKIAIQNKTKRNKNKNKTNHIKRIKTQDYKILFLIGCFHELSISTECNFYLVMYSI